MGGVTIRALGPLEVSVGGERVALTAAKRRAVIAVLALQPGEVVSVAAIIDAVWGDTETGTEHTLQQHISELRKVLEPDRGAGRPSTVLETRAPGYLLHVDESDVADFEQRASAGLLAMEDERPDEALHAFDAALGLWRGRALADLVGSTWFDAVAHRLEERRLAVIEARTDLQLVSGASAELIPELDELTREHPYHERFWAQLMVALYRSGRQRDALDAYQRARTRLVDDLGIEPSPGLRDLEASILAHDPVLDAGASGAGDPHETFRSAHAAATGRLRLPDGQVVALTEGITLIGRNPDARVRLVDSRVSRRHARIDSSPSGHVVCDLGSTNGTGVNGEPVTERSLVDGDIVDIGGVELVFLAADGG